MGILTHKCPHCARDHVALRIRGLAASAKAEVFSLFLICPACLFPIAATIRRNGNHDPGILTQEGSGDVSSYSFQLLKLWPSAATADAPLHCPPEVVRVYVQAERNFPAEGNEEAAGTMYRKALDLALKRVDPNLTGMLGQKIKKLQGKLTPEILEWVDNVRALGNDAAHGDDAISREDLADLRNFSDMVLQYLFTLPGMVKKRRGEKLDWE